jgi:hypothetical protein
MQIPIQEHQQDSHLLYHSCRALESKYHWKTNARVQ